MKYTCGFVLMIMILLGTASCATTANNERAVSEQAIGELTTESAAASCAIPANKEPAPSEQVVGELTTESAAASCATPANKEPAASGQVVGELTAESAAAENNESASSSAQADAPAPSPSASVSAKPSPAPEKGLAATAAEKQACDILVVSGYTQEEILQCFTSAEISDAIFARMQGKTFKKNCTTKRADLRYIRLLHCGFDGQTRIGELVVNKKIAKDILYIFKKLYLADYPIEKMRLADDYNADDDASMADNNTSSFNFRVVEGTKTLSNHAYGLAIDINPLYNPYVLIKNGKKKIEPPDAKKYADRKRDCPYYIKKGDLLWKLFHARGFTWGGGWRSPDYQHFSKNP